MSELTKSRARGFAIFTLGLGLLAGSFGAAAYGQGAPGAGQEDEIKAKELQARIKKEMGEIDELLLKAAKESPKDAAQKLEQVKADLEKLLKDVQTKQSQAVSDIEELLRMAKKSSGQGQGQPQSGDPNSPPNPQQKPGERDKDPEVDKLKQQGQPKDGEKDGKKPEGKGDPKNGGPDKDKPEQDKSEGEKPPSEKSEFQRENVAGRWGVLPPKVSELFQKLSQSEFPDRYRELLTQYYRTRSKSKQP